MQIHGFAGINISYQNSILEFKQLSLFDDPSENRIFLSDEKFKDYFQENKEEIDISEEEFF